MKVKEIIELIKKYGSKIHISREDLEEFINKISNFNLVEKGKVLFHAVTHINCAKKVFTIADIALITAAVAYIIVPTDAIPDFLPIGLLDDLGVLTFILDKFGIKVDQYKEVCMDDEEIDT